MKSELSFVSFAPPIREASPLRRSITAAYRRNEAEALAPLLAAATFDDATQAEIAATARALVIALRVSPRGSGVDSLIREYSLSSQEGVALMCLAEALLRIPDNATRDALIRDKLADCDWNAHLGRGKSLFVNGATWGLVVTGKLVGRVDDRGLGASLNRLIARVGEPVIRRAIDLAMRMMGEQFVTGETIDKALSRARLMEAKGFRYSYDMLGEAATTEQNAARYLADYQNAIHAIGQVAAGRGVYEAPGISIKLSALHPRYVRSQAARVTGELLPRLQGLALLAKNYGIGLNIDAEEADRLELSLDLLESLAMDPKLAGWNGLGFVVQAYGKRCAPVIDWIIDLATRIGRRIMVRLVKGAYWDAEIKRAQVDGLADFPVYTRKIHTDVAYIACARKLLAAREVLFPQFATHNAQTVATIHTLAGPDFTLGDYEYQCLHGMGEPLYEQVVAATGLARPCRVYAPVGGHETLLAYLVRRLLENGANTSFVNQITDPDMSIEDLIADPANTVRAMRHIGAQHDAIAAPADLYPDRRNSQGIDLSDEAALAMLRDALVESTQKPWSAAPMELGAGGRPVLNPGDHRDVVGTVTWASAGTVASATARAAASSWPQMPVGERATILERAADEFQDSMPALMGLAMREAGKSAANAIAEVREAIDFLRYYAARARATFGPKQLPLGPITCISPWNFPLAIFTGQVAAALVAGNPVLAKPAEETPFIAAEAVRLLHKVGVPADALQLLPGDGEIGAALVAARHVAGVMFTGSIEVARLIHRQLRERVSSSGQAIPLIAETGGQNAMVVDSSALAEQVVPDVIASAFDSAGQRCSALRILCLQDDIADQTLAMLKGALAELSIGRTDRLAVDVGPVISEEARTNIEAHVAAMRARGCRVEQLVLPADAAHGTFVAPTIIEIDRIGDVKREVFGPVLHVLRFRRDRLDALIDSINDTGYGLTFGLHTRLDQTIADVSDRIRCGNVYVNRNIIGAVVGVQPFGGTGLSGTGPKAGGPLYLGRLVQAAPALPRGTAIPAALDDLAGWLDDQGDGDGAEIVRNYAKRSGLGFTEMLPGPVGEDNMYALHPRGTLLLRPATPRGLIHQLAAMLATGNRGIIEGMPLPAGLPLSVTQYVSSDAPAAIGAALVEVTGATLIDAFADIGRRGDLIMSIHNPAPDGYYQLDGLLEERATSINTTAAGGNASLMMIG